MKGLDPFCLVRQNRESKAGGAHRMEMDDFLVNWHFPPKV